MRNKIYGRGNAIETLKLVESTSESTLLAVYGRRRIGKTFLIDEYFKDQQEYLFIKNVGIKNEPAENQTKLFYKNVNQDVDKFNKELAAILQSKSNDEGKSKNFKKVEKQELADTTWEAFFIFLSQTIDNLQTAIQQNNLKRKIVYFFDEIPFVAEQTDNFANRLGAIWEKSFNGKKKHIFILCGSSAPWVMQEIVNTKGGLNSRCQHKIKLEPFNYREMTEYITKKYGSTTFQNEKEAVKIYMCLGGVAKYLDFYATRKGRLFNQSISNLMFSEFKDMRTEFDLLMDSLFRNAATHKHAIKYLSTREKGATEGDIINELMANGKDKNEAKRCIKELVDCDYVLEMPTLRATGEEQVFRLIDEYCRFYFKWIHGQGEENFHTNSSYWNNELHNTKIWFDISFEVFCFRNKAAIKNLLGLARFNTSFYSFNLNHKGGAEWDVVVEASLSKKVQGVFIIEIKFKEGVEFSINDHELKALINKIEVLKKTKKYDLDPQIIFLTSDGVIKNENFKKISSGSFTISDLKL